MRENGSPKRLLAGTAVLPVLFSLGLFLNSAATASLPYQALAQAGNEAATNTIFLPLVIHPEPQEPSVWLGEYYDNYDLTDPPAYTLEEARIDYDWGDDSPQGLGDNYFSIRWTGDWDFEAGEYTFFIYSDDGVRLWMDDVLLLDAWTPGMGEHDETVTLASAGRHHLKIEYFERTGDAAIQVQWRRTDLYPEWEGSYYNNPWLEGTRVFERSDRVVQFDWGDGCPDNIQNCDRFSVAWDAWPLLEPGDHRIFIYANEGYRLYVDDEWKGDEGWYSGQSSQDVAYDLTATELDTYKITYHFHDQGGAAEARLWIEYLEHPFWRAEYYTNTSLSGTPYLLKDEDTVFYDWGLGKARPKMPSSNYFSIRWSGERYFHAGAYRFSLFADDGVRLWIDGEKLVDEWHIGRGEYQSPITYLNTGYHEVIIEYYEDSGEAEIRFWFE